LIAKDMHTSFIQKGIVGEFLQCDKVVIAGLLQWQGMCMELL
jgi:hypothetical protein